MREITLIIGKLMSVQHMTKDENVKKSLQLISSDLAKLNGYLDKTMLESWLDLVTTLKKMGWDEQATSHMIREFLIYQRESEGDLDFYLGEPHTEEQIDSMVDAITSYQKYYGMW